MPVVTVDTTEDTQTFQTDQDEAREVGSRWRKIFLLTCKYFFRWKILDN